MRGERLRGGKGERLEERERERWLKEGQEIRRWHIVQGEKERWAGRREEKTKSEMAGGG